MARPLLPDDIWGEIAPPPPRPRPKGGRWPIENRAALTGILFVLRSGLPREMLPAEMGCGCGMSCWRCLRDWQEAGVWARLHQVLLERLHAAGQVSWSWASLDSVSVPAKKGFATRPNSTDRGKPGTRRHLVTDARGTPLGLCLSGANRHDSVMMAQTLDAVPPLRNGRRRRPRASRASNWKS
ncbi:DDE-Tnp-1 domain-containing protein [Methylorubrum extorquens]